MPSIDTLFPFLGLASIIILAVIFLVWKKSINAAPNLAKKPTNGVGQKVDTNVDQKVESFVVGDTNGDQKTDNNVDLIEGFSVNDYVIRKPVGLATSFPKWNAASIRFMNTANDRVYDDYDRENNEPSAELLAQIASAPVSIQPTMPDYGAELGTFDSSTISSIPWDADNKSYIQSDIVWGNVSQQASASIFSKVYHRNLLADSANFIESDSSFQYHSPVLGITTNDATTAGLLTAADATAAVLGQNVLTSLGERASRFLVKAELANQANIAKKLDDLEARGTTLTDAQKTTRLTSRAKAGDLLEQVKLNDRELKIKRGINLNPTELAEQALHDAKNPKKLSWFSKITKRLESISFITKMKSGIAAAKRLAKEMAVKLGQKLARTLGISMASMATTTAITGTLAGATAAAGVGAVATFGALAPLLAILTAIMSAWTALDMICMIIMIGLQIILPAILSKITDLGGVCPIGGKPLDQLISDDFLYFLFTTFVPIGSVLDAFGPYLCYNPDGSTNMKEALYIPPYFSDSTLSLYRHVYNPDETPRGDRTRYTNAADSVPAGWSYVDGIARSPCDPGTWTSSDVDLLCNISTYVPITYVKKSRVPVTGVKDSRVNPTKAKVTGLQTFAKGTYGRGTGEEPIKAPCPNGWRDDQTSCWEDLQC